MALPIIPASALSQQPTQEQQQQPEVMSTTTTQPQQQAFKPIPAASLAGGEVTAVPEEFNGLSPDQALNSSDIELTHRLNMGFGNERGNLKYLKQLGYEATMNKNGELVYRKPGADLWRRVDEKDSWSLSEMIKDTAEALPEIGTFVAQTGASIAAASLTGAGILAAPVTGGTSIAASLAGAGALMGITAGISKAASTSFGRHLGTYEDTAEGQVMDVLLETGLNFAGGAAGKAFELGAVPVAKTIGKKLIGASEFVKNGGDTARGMMRFLFKHGLNTTDDSAAFAANNLAEVGGVLEKFPATAGKSAIKEATDVENIKYTQLLAKTYKDAASFIYREDEEFIKKAAELAGTKMDPIDLADSVLRAVGKGRGLFRWTAESVDEAGKEMLIKTQDLRFALKLADGDVTKLGLDLVDDMTIASMVDDAIIAGDSSLEKVAELLSNESGRKQLHSGVTRVVKNLLNWTEKEGGDAATALIRYNKLIRRQLRNMSEVASSGTGAERNLALASFFDDMYFDVGSVFSRTLDPISNGRFSQMNATHHALRRGTKMFEDAAVAFEKDATAYAKLYNQLKTQSTLGTYRNTILKDPEALIKQRAPELAKVIESTSHKIDLNLTAQEFGDWINPKVAGYIAPGIGIAVGTGTLNPLAGLVAAGVATSPRLAARTFGAAARLAGGRGPTQLVSQLAQSKEALNGLRVVKGMSALLKADAVRGSKAVMTAEAFKQLMDKYMMAPFEQQQMRDQLLQQGGIGQ